MKNIIAKTGFGAFVLFLSSFVDGVAAEFRGMVSGHVEYPGWFRKDPFFDTAEALARSKAENRHGLMVLFTTEGCSYCAVFIQKSLGDPAIAARVQKNFESIGLEIFDDSEMTDPRGRQLAVKQFASEEGAGFSPTLVFYDTTGKRVARAVGYLSPERFTAMMDYVTSGHHQSETLAEYFRRTGDKAGQSTGGTAMRDDPMFGKPPYVLDRSHFPAGKPLLVLFERPGCAECEAFHTDVLALDEVRNVLSGFEVVRLDASNDKTPVLAPNGSRTDPAAWFRKSDFSRVPALLFFDEQGNQVLETDSLVQRTRMLNSLNFVLERAYEKNWTYQRFARSKAIERNLKKKQAQ